MVFLSINISGTNCLENETQGTPCRCRKKRTRKCALLLLGCLWARPLPPTRGGFQMPQFPAIFLYQNLRKGGKMKDVKSYWNSHNGYSDYIVASLTSIFWRVCIYWYQTQSALHRWGGDSGDESEVLMQDTHGLIWIRVNLYFCIHA